MSEVERPSIARLRSQLSRAELVLFTGAGFSRGAMDREGRPLPTTAELKADLWDLCFPGDPMDGASTLGELYELAMHRKGPALRALLEERLSVDPDSLPEFYRLFFEFPWARVYTLNVDDVALAVTRRFDLARSIRLVAATGSGAAETARGGKPELEVVHLNGMIPAPLGDLTFSESQYAQRIANQEPWYARCAADLTSRATIFIGTELREVPLWQHMELRRRRSTGARDLRPTSILVTPTLTASRRELLRELRIEWFEGTAESFAREILEPLIPNAAQGLRFLQEQYQRSGRASIPLVIELAAERPDLDTDYLLGAEPHWSDFYMKRAAERADDEVLYESAKRILSGALPDTALAVTGTAGTGKSTALMRLALRLTAEGTPVLWVDRDSEAGPSLIRSRVRDSEGPLALAVDDADLFGRQLLGLLRDLVPSRKNFLFLVALRSTKVDDLADAVRRSKELSLLEHTVPNLTDGDIDGLVAVLDRHNRLGVLKGMTEVKRRKAFEAEAGRQLLVAMIQATSGLRFEEKAQEELTDLEGLQKYIYALIAVTSGSRLYLTRDEILLASSDAGDEAVTALDRLMARHVIVSQPPDYHYKARHRVIADLVVDKLRELDQLPDVLVGLAFAAASKVDPLQDRRHRAWRLLVRVINHKFLLKLLKVSDARAVFEEVENILSFDYHYWLQRGSLEVQAGDVRLADNFLSQARSIRPEDYRVETEYGYMLMRRAYEEPERTEALGLVGEGTRLLEGVIAMRGDDDPYPFHVLGSQGLAWVRRAGLDPTETRDSLQRFLCVVEDGLRRHPGRQDLRQLAEDIRHDYLMTAVRRGGS
jgi:SIR2-like domain